MHPGRRGGVARPSDVKTSSSGRGNVASSCGYSGPHLSDVLTSSQAPPILSSRSTHSALRPQAPPLAGAAAGAQNPEGKQAGWSSSAQPGLPRRAWVAKSRAAPPLRGDDGDREPAQAGRTERQEAQVRMGGCRSGSTSAPGKGLTVSDPTQVGPLGERPVMDPGLRLLHT